MNHQILLIDNNSERRDLSFGTLQSMFGLIMPPAKSYDDASQGLPKQVDVVILVCAEMGQVEKQLIRQHILAPGRWILVVMESVSVPMIRDAFLLGVDDVATDPYNPAWLVDVVNDTLETLASKRRR